jgi:hypothetical protein
VGCTIPSDCAPGVAAGKRIGLEPRPVLDDEARAETVDRRASERLSSSRRNLCVIAIDFGGEPRRLLHGLTDTVVTEVASDGINEGGPAAMTFAGRPQRSF